MKRIYLLGVTVVISIFATSISTNLFAQSGRRIIVDAADNTNSGLKFTTIKMAVDSALNGDTVIVKEGTYREKVRTYKKLILASEFLLDGDTSHISKTIITGDSIVQSNISDALINASGSDRDTSYFKLIGLTVKNASKWAVYLNYGVIRSCIFLNSGSLTSVPFTTTGAMIVNSKFINNIGMAIIQLDWMNQEISQTPILKSNLFVNNKALGVNGYQHGQNNSGIIYFNGTPAKLFNNIFYNNSGDNVLSFSGQYKFDRVRDTLVFANNTFYKNNTRLAFIRTWDGSTTSLNWVSYFYNNIIDNNFESATNKYVKGEFMWGGTNSRDSKNTFRNNIMASALNTEPSTGFSGNFTFDFNNSNTTGTVKFKDTASYDFSLTDNSPGLGMGITNSNVPVKDYYDVSVRPLPAGSNPDAGAIESSKKMPDPSILSLKNVVYNSMPVVSLNYSIFNAPAIDSVIIYRDSVTAPVTPTAFDTIKYDATAKSIYIDSVNLTKGKKYFYQIKTYVTGGTIISGSSTRDSILVPAVLSIVKIPVLLTPTQDRQSVSLSWTLANASAGTFVDIYKGTTVANATLLTSIKDTATTYNDSSIAQSTRYYYYLANRDAAGITSESSASINITTNGATPYRFYVDKTNGRDTYNGTSPATAVQTLAKVFTKAIKGDTVIIYPGTYNSKFNVAPGVIIGSKYLIDNTDTAAISATILSAAGLKGTMISYSSSSGTWVNNTRTKYIGLSFTGATGTTKLFSYSWGNPSALTIDHCKFYNNGNQTVPTPTDGNWDDVTKFVNFGDSTVISNSIFENNFGKIRFDANSFTVTKNIFRNNNNSISKPQYWIRTGILDGWVNGNNRITDNIFSNNGTLENSQQNGNNRQSYIISIGGSDTLFVANNTFEKNLNVPYFIDNSSPTAYLVNNIFNKNEADFYIPSWVNTLGDLYIENNFFNKNPANETALDKANVAYSNNMFGADPVYTDSISLKLAASSTLINAGKNTYGKNNIKSVSTTDLYGTARPLPTGTKSDIGAAESEYGFSAPTIVSIDGSDKSVSIKWTKPTNAIIAGYEIIRSTSSILDNSTAASTFTISNPDSLTKLDTALTNLTRYYYRVKAFTNATPKVYSGLSNELSSKPNTPPTSVDTVAAFGGTRSVVLKWSDTSSVKRKYNVYRGTDAADLVKIAENVDTTYYVDKSSISNVTYYYGIKVVDSVGAASSISKLGFAKASNVWIIDTAGKETGNGSANYPIKSIQYAIDNSNAGDTILINNGTYAENLKVYGKVITMMAKNRGKANITPLDPSGSPILEVRDQNNSDNYTKAKNKFVGLIFSGSTYTNWNNGPPAAVSINYNSNPTFESCSFSNNSSQFVLMFDQSAPTFINCLVNNNSSNQGVIGQNGGQDAERPKTKVARFINSIITNNTYISRWNTNREKSVVFLNSIFSENGYDNQFNDKLFRVAGSIVDNAKLLAQSATNIQADPQFNNTAAGDYSLSNFSPALGKSKDSIILLGGSGNDTVFAVAYDYNYATRPNPTGTKADLGAFESKFSIAAPQITRLEKTGSNVTLTWAKTDATATLALVQVYRDTLRSALDTIAPLTLTVDTATRTIADVLPSNNKEYFYAIKATIGTGTAAVKTGFSNIKSSKDTIFVPALVFAIDTASFKVRAANRNSNALGQSINLVKLASDAATDYPKLILYSQAFKEIDSTKGGYPADSLTVLNILAGSGTNKIKFSLNKRVSLAKAKGDYMQIVSAMNVNGDNEFDLVALYRKKENLDNQTQIAYITNNNLAFKLDTALPKRAYFNPTVNAWNQTTNLSYKWDKKTFRHEGNTNFGQNIELAAEFMDGNFDGKEELVANLNQVKWEPNASLNLGQNSSMDNINTYLKPIKFVDINNDGIPDIFAMTNNSWALGMSNVNGNPLVVFVSNKKDGKFYLYLTGINVDWGANVFFGDFQSNRKVQVLTRTNGGNYRVYDFDNTYNAVSASMQVNTSLNDGRLDVGDINNDGYPDIVTLDNSGNFVAYVNTHQSEFTKKIIGTTPYSLDQIWTTFNLKIADVDRDGFKDLMWMEIVPEADGGIRWESSNFVIRTWRQTPGAIVRNAPAAVSAANIKVSNDGYKVKVKWTPTTDPIDSYMYANVKVDTIDTYAAARINNPYNYRNDDPTVPIVLDKVFARNYPDSLEFTDINLTSKKPYYVKLQMVNKIGQSSVFTEKVFSPKDPLASVDNVIPGLYNAKFAWGDYNNDGLLDLAVMGQSDNGNVTKIYQNKGGTFEDLNLTNRAFRLGDIKWVDLNNDGWLDVAMIGQPGASGASFQVLINNKGSFEVSSPTSVFGLKNSNMAFGDYDNNGTLDMFTTGQDATGNAHSYLYTNDGKGNFTNIPELNSLNIVPNLFDADARFVDYDLDGDLDLVYAGTDQNNNPQGAIRVNTILDPKLSTNNYGNGNFNNGYTFNLNSYNNACNCNLGLAMKKARFDMGDIDGDGDIDIVEIGTARISSGSTTTDVPQLLILRNQTIENKNAKYGSYFSYGNIYGTTAIVLDSISDGDVKLVDFNNDGLLDITVTGLDSKATPVTKFYLNEGGFGNYTLSINANIPQLSSSAISWGDANGDGNMDLVVSGNKAIGSTTNIYLNDQGTNNNVAPSSPKNLRFIDQGQGRVLLQWDAAADDHTRPDNLYYNLKLGTKPGLSDLRVIQVNAATDQLQTPNTSLIGSNQYYIELPPGVYYWSVQAVDGNFTSSKFAANQRIVLKYPWQFVNQGGIVDTRIQPLEKPAFAWADVNNKGVFDFLYLGHVTTGMGDYNNQTTPAGLYRNMGGKFAKLSNDSTRVTIAGKGTGFNELLSGIVNAEIKWTDINNDGLVDLIVAGTDYNSGKGRLKVLRNKGNYKFEDVTSALYTGNLLSNPKIEFVDLDNNGLRDVVYTGLNDLSVGVFKFIGVYKDTASSNKLGIKTAAITNNLDVLLTNDEISNVSLSFGDLNKDFKTDLAILYDNRDGARKGEVYMNTSDTSNKISFVRNATVSLPTLSNATLDLIDYNNDGLLDLALSGRSQATGQVFRIYQNKYVDSAAKTIQFIQTNSAVKPFESGQTTWGDINSDGYPDIIFSGVRTGSGNISAMAIADPSTAKVNGIIKYNELPTFPFGDYSTMRPSLGDFSGKKVLDLVLVGTENVKDPIAGTTTKLSSFKILKNVRDLSAKVVDPGTAVFGSSTETIKSMATSGNKSSADYGIASVKGFADSTITIADPNYTETSYAGNLAPTSPKIDTSKIISKVDDRYLVQLNWQEAVDDNTPSTGLTYAVAIGSQPGKIDVLDPNAELASGVRKTPEMGNAGKNKSTTVLLAPGTYYWSVQSIDAANAGSKFTATKTIQVSSTRTLVERSAPYNILLNGSTVESYYLKQNDSTGFKYKVTAMHEDTTMRISYSFVSGASDAIFKLDTVNKVLQLNNKPTASSYKATIRATDIYGGYFDKLFTFQVVQAPNRVLVNDKDTSLVYYTNATADVSKLKLSLKAAYDVTPTIEPVITYQYVSGVNGENNDLFELVNSVVINKRKLNDADTIRLKVSAVDQFGLVTERIIKLINSDCPTKPSLSVKASATACLPLVVNLTDTALVSGTATGLTFGYYSDINTVNVVADPTKVAVTGTYYIRATTAAGCAIAKPIAISVAAQPAVPTVTASNACQNQAGVTINYTAPSSIVKLVWYGTNATGGTASTAKPTFNTSTVGTQSYYVAQADTVAGCYSDRVKLDIKVLAVPTAPTITRDTAGNLVASVSSGSVKWYKETTLVDSVNYKFKPSGPGSYTIKLTDNGCTSTASAAYYFLVTDIINLSSSEYIKLAPNPFTGTLVFDFAVKGYQKLNLDVFETSTGRKVDSRQGVYSGTKLSFNGLSNGVYVFRVSSADSKLAYHFKIIKL